MQTVRDCHVLQEKCRLRSPNGARFCPNPPRRRGEGAAAGRRISRDAAASTIHIHTQGTLPALVGAFISRRPCVNPLPCPDLPRIGQFFSWTRSTACLSAQSVGPLCPAVTGLNLMCTVLSNVRGWHNGAVSAHEPRAAIGWRPSTPPR